MSKLRMLGAGAVVLMATTGAATPAGAAGWSPATYPLPGGGEPAVAMNARGDVVIAARSGTGALVSERPAGGTFETPVPVGTGGSLQADVAINAAGDVAVAWASGGMAHLAVRPRGGTFSTPQDFPNLGGSIHFVDVGIDDAGNAALAWTVTGTNAINTVVRAAAGTLGTITATAPGQPAGSQFDLAMSGRGDAIVVATRSDGTSYIAQAATLAAGASSFAPFTSLSATGQSATSPVAAIDGLGRSAVAWYRSDGTNQRVQVSYHAPGGVFTLPADASPAGTTATYPAIAIADSGDVVVGWTANSVANARAGSFGSSFSTPITQFPTGGGHVSAAMGADGSSALSWGTGGAADLWTATGPAPGPFTTAGPLASGVSVFGNVVETPVAADAAGDAAVAFTGAGKAGISLYDKTPPELRGLSVPGTGTIGSPLAFSVAPWDAFTTIDAPHWDFGDGNSADGASVTHAYAAGGTYTVKVKATDAADNAGTATRTVTVPAAPSPPGTPPPAPPGTTPGKPVPPPVVCKVPSLKNLTTARAKAKLRRAHCALGKVTTPKKYKKTKGLVIRSQSRKAGTKTKAGAKVNVTLGPKPKPKRKRHA